MAITYKKTKPSTVDLLVGSSSIAVELGTFPVGQMDTAEMMPLISAKRLLQPVSASSMGSRYFVVALRPDLKIAARYKDDHLSIRAEGDGMTKFAPNLSNAGFKNDNGYRSLHLGPVGGPAMMGRTLGSVLLGLNIEFTTIAAQPQVLVGKGK